MPTPQQMLRSFAAIAALLGLGWVGPGVHAAPGVSYTLTGHRVTFASGADVTPGKSGSFTIPAGILADSLSLVEAVGHSITSVGYNPLLGKRD